MGFPEVWGRQGLAPGTEWDVSATVTEWQLQTWNMSTVCIWLRPSQLSRQTLERYLVNLSHVFTEERRMFYPFVAFCFIICHQNKQHKELRTTMIQPFFFPKCLFFSRSVTERSAMSGLHRFGVDVNPFGSKYQDRFGGFAAGNGQRTYTKPSYTLYVTGGVCPEIWRKKLGKKQLPIASHSWESVIFPLQFDGHEWFWS